MKAKHYINYITLLLIGIALAVTSCKEEDKAEMIEISLDKNNVVLKVGMSETLNVTPNVDVDWTTTNPEVATVNNGVVTAVGLGNAKINAKTGRSLAFCEVSVIDEPIPVTGVTITLSDTVLAIGDMITLESVVLPDTATYKNVKWSSSNPEIVAVDDLTGEVTALAIGQATITATTVDGDKTATSIVDVWPSLTLNRPFNAVEVSLNPADPSGILAFSWNPFEGTTDYIVKISGTEDFETTIFEQEVTGGSLEVPSYELNELLKTISSDDLMNIYWTVHPKDPIDVLGEVRTIEITPDRHDYLLLQEESAENLTLNKAEGEYHYAINASEASKVNTMPLAGDLDSDFNMLSISYKSEAELPSVDVDFIKSDGTVAGTITTNAFTSSSEWNEFAVSVNEARTTYDWGAEGDYLGLNFGTNWSAEINAIHLRKMNDEEIKESYVPQFFTIVSASGHVTLTTISDYHYKLITTGTDPNIRTANLVEALPKGANQLVFEYKSTQQLGNNLQIFSATPTQGLAEGRSFKLGTLPASAEWKVYTVDMQPAIDGWGWGVAGSYLRMDTGERTDYDMEIRNIRVVFPD